MGLTETLKGNRATIVCGLVVVLALFAGLVARGRLADSADARLVALVHDGDGQVHELPLDTDARLTVTTSLGTNVIAVEDGSVRMAEADCPNRSCVQAPALSEPGAQIICLPHELWIEVVPQGSTGSQLDVSLAADLGDDIDLQAR